MAIGFEILKASILDLAKQANKHPKTTGITLLVLAEFTDILFNSGHMTKATYNTIKGALSHLIKDDDSGGGGGGVGGTGGSGGEVSGEVFPNTEGSAFVEVGIITLVIMSVLFLLVRSSGKYRTT